MALQTKTLTANGAKGHHKFTLTVAENSTSVSNNTSSLSFSFVLSPIQTSWDWALWGSSISYTININGTKYTGTIPDYDGYSSVTLKSGSLSVAHNSDGTKNISISFSVADGAGQYYTCGNASSSGTMTLTTIPRASSISSLTSSVAVNGKNNVTVNINSASTSFKHQVDFYINDTYKHTVYDVDKTASYAIPTTWLNAMPSSTSCTAYCKVTTYNGGTQLGSAVTKSFTVTVPSNVMPTIGQFIATPETINGQNILVQNKNKLTLKVSNCSAGTGSSIKSYKFSGPDMSITTTGTSVTSSGGISVAGDLSYGVTVTDTRGRTASSTITVKCYEWSAPTIRITSAFRVAASSDTTETSSGTIVKFTYAIEYSSVNNTNKIDVKLYSKQQSSSNYTLLGNVLTASTVTTGTHAQGGYPSDQTHEIYLSISDKYSGSNTSQTITIFSEGRIMNIRPKGTGIAFGKMAENDNVLASRWPIKTDDAPNTMKNLTYRGQNISSIDQDTSQTWVDMGNLATTYYSKTGYINGQPAQYGYLVNITAGPNSTQVHQLWATQPNGALFHRGGNTSSGFGTTWKEILDNSNCKDYIVAQGTSGKTTYRKWNSGLAEMWYYEELGKMALTTSMVSGVYSNTNCNSRGASFPAGLFLTGTMPMATINVYSNGYTFCQVSEVQLDKNQFVYRVWSPYSTTIDSCNISIYATGKWK